MLPNPPRKNYLQREKSSMKKIIYFYLLRLNYLVLFFLSCFSSTSFAGSACENMQDGEVMRLDSKGEILEHVLNPKQGTSNFCWAAASTQLYDAYRLKKSSVHTPVLVSSPFATTIMVLENEYKQNNNFQRSISTEYSLRKSFFYLMEEGSCSLDRFFDVQVTDGQTKLANFSNIYKELESIYFLDLNYAFRYKRFKDFVKKNYRSNIYHLLFVEEENRNQIKSAFYSRKDFNHFLNRLTSILCPLGQRLKANTRTPSLVNLSFYDVATKSYNPGENIDQKYKNLLRKRVKQDFFILKNFRPLPKVVGMCGNALTNANLPPLQLRDGSTAYDVESDTCSNHYLVVMGLRKSGQSCEWLVRNSAGQSCSSYVPGKIKCDEVHSPNLIWMEEGYLTSYVSEMFTIEE